MRGFPRIFLGVMLASAAAWWTSPSLAQGYYGSSTRRSSASVLSATANANANNAVGNPYVNPNAAHGRHGTQRRASANANAAEMRATNQNVTTP